MHFLKKAALRSHAIGKPRAAVRVKFDSKKKALVLSPEEERPIMVLRDDALIAEVPADIEVLDPNGNAIPASGKFFVTTETFDPYHAVVDLPK